jgi:hypothetical protein
VQAPIVGADGRFQTFLRTINVSSLKNEDEGIARQIRNAAIDALNENFVPNLRSLMSECARLIFFALSRHQTTIKPRIEFYRITLTRIAPPLLAQLVALDFAGRGARRSWGNFEPPSFL